MNPNDESQRWRGRIPSEALDLTPNEQGVHLRLNYTRPSAQEALQLLFTDPWAGDVMVSFATTDMVPSLIAGLTEFMERIDEQRANWRTINEERP